MLLLIIQVLSVFYDKECLNSFFLEYTLTVDCFKIFLSKTLGYLIILGSVLVKLPQIIKIFKSGSGEGLNFFGIILEMVACGVTMLYSIGKGFPFSSFGESFFMTFQQFLIFYLFLLYEKNSTELFYYCSISVGIFSFFLLTRPLFLLSPLQSLSILILLLSRMSQVYTNYLEQSTGQLSLITIFLQFFGGLTRIFTSIVETGDSRTIIMYIVSSFSSGFLLFQIFLYWKNTVALENERIHDKLVERQSSSIITFSSKRKTFHNSIDSDIISESI